MTCRDLTGGTLVCTLSSVMMFGLGRLITGDVQFGPKWATFYGPLFVKSPIRLRGLLVSSFDSAPAVFFFLKSPNCFFLTTVQSSIDREKNYKITTLKGHNQKKGKKIYHHQISTIDELGFDKFLTCSCIGWL